jgi:hypothetical protein
VAKNDSEEAPVRVGPPSLYPEVSFGGSLLGEDHILILIHTEVIYVDEIFGDVVTTT